MGRVIQKGFTIVELLVVVVVIAVLAAITLVTYTGIQDKARTSRSLATADQVRSKASVWNTLQSSYPNLAQLRTNSLDPIDIDTANGGAGPIEAKLTSPSIVMGAPLDVVRANNGDTVYYLPCGSPTKHTGATIMYWDYSQKSAVTLTAGLCP